MAISAFYAAKAVVELINVDRLFSNASDQEKSPDLDLLKQLSTRFVESRTHWCCLETKSMKDNSLCYILGKTKNETAGELVS